MGVYVILDGVRREYPDAVRWEDTRAGTGIIIVGQKPCAPPMNPYPPGRIYFDDYELAQYGRYDLVGWMEENGNEL